MCRWLFVPLLALGFADAGVARTLFSGSFVQLAVEDAAARVSVNYPRQGAGKICGIELKSSVFILHRRVWETLAEGLAVTATYEGIRAPSGSLDVGGAQVISPVIEVHEGPRLAYIFDRFDADYGTLTLATRDGTPLAAYFARALGVSPEAAGMVVVSRECL